jgi:transcriptional regulator with XRE-family HTH domain
MTAKQLKALMAKKELSSRDIADALGVTRRMVFYWLSGEQEIKPIYSELLTLKFGGAK